MNLGRLLRPSFDGGERAMILESRMYAVHDPNYHDNSDHHDFHDNTDNNNIAKERDSNAVGVKGKNKRSNDVTDDEVENEVKCERTYSVTCSYYRPVLVIRDEASKYGVRRACVLLGENGTYVRANISIQTFAFFVLHLFLFEIEIRIEIEMLILCRSDCKKAE